MYDRTRAHTVLASPGGVLARADAVDEDHKADGAVVYSWRDGPLTLRLRGAKLRIDGSLSEYVADLAPPPAAVAALAGARIEERYGVAPDTLRVTRLEVFADLVLDFPPSLCLPLLFCLARHDRLRVDGQTVKFFTRLRSYILYDKARERGLLVPGGLLRVELAYMNGGVARYLGDDVTLAALASPEVRAEVSGEWERFYDRIEKGREFTFDAGARGYRDSLAVRGLAAEGVANALARITANRKAGSISKQAASDYRRQTLRLARHPEFTQPSPLLAELAAAVANAVSRMRQYVRMEGL